MPIVASPKTTNKEQKIVSDIATFSRQISLVPTFTQAICLLQKVTTKKYNFLLIYLTSPQKVINLQEEIYMYKCKVISFM